MMSLDVWLEATSPIEMKTSGIFVRRNGQTVEISRAEWDEMCPGHEPTIFASPTSTNSVFEGNITHNLRPMASAAGLDGVLWFPEEDKLWTAFQLIEPLRTGLQNLRDMPEYFKALNPANGWGNYDRLVSFVSAYLAACEANPNAKVKVSR